MFHLPFDYEAFAQAGGLIGHAGITVFDDSVDMAQMARFAMEFCAVESCGKCTPCRIGSTRRSEEHTSELQSLMRNSSAVFCLKKKTQHKTKTHRSHPR